MIRVHAITAANRAHYQSRIAALEQQAQYPLGSDFFRLDHGKDYFAFFERLGELHYYALETAGEVVAVAAGVLRRVKLEPERPAMPVWYLCDLKVLPAHRGRHYPWRIFRHAFLPNYLRCRRGYAISMNPEGGRPNPVVRLMQRFRWAPFRSAGNLGIYSLDCDGMLRVRPLLEKARGPLQFLSLQGKKDLILSSTGQPWPILHAQYGPCAEKGLPDPQPGFTHLFCCPESDPLAASLARENCRPSSTATLLTHRLRSDWRFILTSDI